MLSLQCLPNVARRVFVQLPVLTEDDDCHIHGAKDGELVRLLEEATLALQERSGKRLDELCERGWWEDDNAH